MGKKGASLTFKNSCMRLLLVGMLQCAYERAFKMDSSVDWEGTLRVRVWQKLPGRGHAG